MVQMFRDGIRKAKAQLELEAMSDVKDSHKTFYKYWHQRKAKEIWVQCSVELEN